MYEKKGAIPKMASTRSWNWPGFFLANFWMFYRGMYLQGSIFSAIFILAGVIEQTTKINTTGGMIGLMVVLGMFSNGLYFQHVERRIKELRATTSPNQLDDKLRLAGNPNLGIAIGLGIAFSILGIALSYGIRAMGWEVPQ